ncbi:hypothetical protein AMTR_s00039p00114600 [Amborella trichopoda]|uniref:Uncharacterized protein n=1 Tax=Amborella trichopoda TaxID=13333 RepID=U5D030_AMBTC|nr:hypothetical protein AMTR_s00039p00114600 [Amborella trichopoda]
MHNEVENKGEAKLISKPTQSSARLTARRFATSSTQNNGGVIIINNDNEMKFLKSLRCHLLHLETRRLQIQINGVLTEELLVEKNELNNYLHK